jgi:hypothetical protein
VIRRKSERLARSGGTITVSSGHQGHKWISNEEAMWVALEVPQARHGALSYLLLRPQHTALTFRI